MGFVYVDLLLMEGWAHINPSVIAEDPEHQATHVARLLKSNNLKVVALNANVSAPLSTEDPEKIVQNAKEAKAMVSFARALESPILVFQPGSVSEGQDREPAVQSSIESLRRITDEAFRRRVPVAIEPHAGSLADGYIDALRFTAQVPGLKLAYDPSHFVMAQYDLEGSEVLLQHTAHIHLRNAVKGNFQAPMSEGELDFMWVLEAVDAAGYNGSISIEYLDNRGSDIVADVHALKALLERRYRHV